MDGIIKKMRKVFLLLLGIELSNILVHCQVQRCWTERNVCFETCPNSPAGDLMTRFTARKHTEGIIATCRQASDCENTIPWNILSEPGTCRTESDMMNSFNHAQFMRMGYIIETKYPHRQDECWAAHGLCYEKCSYGQHSTATRFRAGPYNVAIVATCKSVGDCENTVPWKKKNKAVDCDSERIMEKDYVRDKRAYLGYTPNPPNYNVIDYSCFVEHGLCYEKCTPNTWPLYTRFRATPGTDWVIKKCRTKQDCQVTSVWTRDHEIAPCVLWNDMVKLYLGGGSSPNPPQKTPAQIEADQRAALERLGEADARRKLALARELKVRQDAARELQERRDAAKEKKALEEGGLMNDMKSRFENIKSDFLKSESKWRYGMVALGVLFLIMI